MSPMSHRAFSAAASMCTFAATSLYFLSLLQKTSLSIEALQASAFLISHAPKGPVNLHVASDFLRRTPASHKD